MAYGYSRTLTVTSNSALLPSTQTNFAVLVKISDATMKTVANGGRINNTVTAASGPAVTMPADLIFTSDSGGTTKIPWEIDSYDGTNGVVWAWVQIASCALSTVFYVFYGDAAIVAAQNTGSFTPANVWDTNFKFVYHAGDGTTLQLTDTTAGGANPLTNTNVATSVAGQIGGAVNLVAASSQSVNHAANIASLQITNNITLSAWAKSSTATQQPSMVNNQCQNGTNVGVGIGYTGGLATVSINSGSASDSSYQSSGSITDGTWHHVVFTFASSSGILYVDGVAQATKTYGFSAIGYSATPKFYIGRNFTGNHDTQVVDEVRISSSVRGPDWVTAEYNNALNPTTFITIGSESPVGGGGGGLGSRLLLFGCGM